MIIVYANIKLNNKGDFMSSKETAQIGIIGGTGFYSFFENSSEPCREVIIDTPYGETSSPVIIGEVCGKKTAFIPRHGKKHQFLPHTVNYRANVWALKSLGITRVISPCAAGSLQKHIKPGDFVICDQYVDWTDNRKNTFIEGPECIHPSAADPYCPELRQIAAQQAEQLGIPVHKTGTVVVVNGPRFSTKAESKFFTQQGWEVINMTQYPEVHLVMETGMCPLTIALITDYDAGLIGNVPPVTHQQVEAVFKSNIDRLKKLLVSIAANIPNERNLCGCSNIMHIS